MLYNLYGNLNVHSLQIQWNALISLFFMYKLEKLEIIKNWAQKLPNQSSR